MNSYDFAGHVQVMQKNYGVLLGRIDLDYTHLNILFKLIACIVK